MENFPWNRVAPTPSSQKPLADLERLRTLPPAGVREAIGDGTYGGAYEKPDAQMLEIWRAVKRLGTPDDIAYGVLIFASDYAAWCTGQVPSIDSGKALF